MALFWRGKVLFVTTGVRKPKKRILISDCMNILRIGSVKNTVENVDWIVLKAADQSYLVKIVFIMHTKCSQSSLLCTLNVHNRLYYEH